MLSGATDKIHPITILCLLFTILGVIYATVLPIFEGADEISHFRVIEFMADNRAIPHIVTDAEEVGHEGGQPPLYYAVLSPIVGAVDRSDFDQTVWMNPHFLHLNSNHVWMHLTNEINTWSGVVLAVRLGRFASVLMGAVSVWATWATASIITQNKPHSKEFALLAAGLVAFNPQFLAISGSINNDNLVILFCSIALWLTVRWTHSENPSIYTPLLIGLVTGLAILSKVSGLAFGLVIAWVLIAKWRKSGRFVPAFSDGLMILGGVLLVCGWWLWRNQSLYGDPLGLAALRIAHSGTYRDIPLTLAQTLSESTLILKTFWLFPGNGTLFGPDWFYWVPNLACAFGLIMLIISVGRKQNDLPKALPILTVWLIGVSVLLFYWISTVGATSQGRLLYPAISAFALLVVAGIWQLGQIGRWLTRGLVLFLAGFAIATPFLITLPAFSHPAPLAADAEIPNRFGEPTLANGIDLLGHEIIDQNLSIGDRPRLRLYWQATEPVPESYFITVHFVDSAGTEVSRYEGYPAGGRYPTNLWEPNKPFSEEITLEPITPNAVGGLATYWVDLTTWDGSTATEAKPLAAQSKIRLETVGQQSPTERVGLTFGNLAILAGYTAIQTEDVIEVALDWRVLEADPVAYTVFVHLIDQSGELVAQGDGVPRNGTYPTDYWEHDELIRDRHMIPIESVPAGTYTIAIGLYDPISGSRLMTQEQTDNFRISVNIEQ